MFNKNEFFSYIEKEFNVDGATFRLISNCIEFLTDNYGNDFVNKLYEILDGTIGIEKEEITLFYNQ